MNEIGPFQNIKLSRVQRHLVFWISFLLLDIFRYILKSDDPLLAAFIFNFSALVPQMGFTYVLSYWILPKLIDRRTRRPYILVLIAVVYFFAALNRIIIVHVAEDLVIQKPFVQEPILEILTDLKSLLSRYVPSNLWVALVFIFIKYFFEQEKAKSLGLQLEKEKAEIELKALKAQLNPHFLFNTLNNIYSLSIANSPKASTAIGKLSDILDHVLYRSEGDMVLLSSEMSLLQNYIELEQLRYDERLRVDVDSAVDEKAEIPPLILLSLVENAFKHGAGEDSGSPEIQISARSEAGRIRFRISNTIAGEIPEVIQESIGMSNLRRQLALIYKDDFDLQIDRSADRFTVTLNLPGNKQ